AYPTARRATSHRPRTAVPVPRAGLSHDAVVRLAVEVVDEAGATGFADLTLAKVAARAGVAAPSLYKHVGSLADLRREVAVLAVRLQTAAGYGVRSVVRTVVT